jgi:hypothetical protein
MSLHDFYIEADGPRARNGKFGKKAQRGARNRGNTMAIVAVRRPQPPLTSRDERPPAQLELARRAGPIQTTTHGSTFAFLGAILAIITCCVSLPSVSGDPITDIDQIVGKWAGTITPGHNSAEEPFYLIVMPDGRLVAGWGVDTSWGTVTLRNGEATFEMKPPIAEGSIRLDVDGGQRTLVMAGVLPSFRAQVTPQD